MKYISTFIDSKPVGIFKVDVATVYHEREHAFERRWAQLMDPNAMQVVFGHLLLSIAITEQGVSSKVRIKKDDLLCSLRKTQRFSLVEYSR